jgi:hypothetical protein
MNWGVLVTDYKVDNETADLWNLATETFSFQ